jgi:hypothetical protein
VELEALRFGEVAQRLHAQAVGIGEGFDEDQRATRPQDAR